MARKKYRPACPDESPEDREKALSEENNKPYKVSDSLAPLYKKAFRTEDDLREAITALLMVGTPARVIQEAWGIPPKEFTDRFEDEIAGAKLAADSKVVSWLFSQCAQGNTQALIYWTKAQMKWSDRNENDLPRLPTVSPILNIMVSNVTETSPSVQGGSRPITIDAGQPSLLGDRHTADTLEFTPQAVPCIKLTSD